MTEQEAHAIVSSMHAAAWVDIFRFAARIDVLETEYEKDPLEGTKRKIRRLTGRLMKRAGEAEALSLVLDRHEPNVTTPVTEG